MKKCVMMMSGLFLLAMGAFAQTDVTKYYLENYGFDDNFDYTSGQTTEVKQELKSVDGWTSELGADYTIVGTYEYGFKGTFNTASVPGTGYDGEDGGGLAISTGWEQTFLFYQTVTLPAGTYKLSVPTYNGSDVTAATSQVAWIPSSGTAVRSKVTSYPAKKWTLDEISFTLTKSTTGKIQFGMKAAAGGSGNTAKLVVDYVKLLGSDMDVNGVKTDLQTVITTATNYYGEGTGVGAADLQTAINTAQGVYDNAEADVVMVLEAITALNEAVTIYRQQNISEDNPQDVTTYIVNPSFENSTNGWVSENLSAQSNSSFTKKAGSYYLEKWTASGSVGNGYVKQTIKNIPNGIYKMTVAAQNYTQTSTSKKNTGAYVYAGDQKEIVYTPGDYSVKFTSIAGEVEIGFVAENATGNWIAVDNFRLYLIGHVDAAAALAELTRIVGEAEGLQGSMMSATAAFALQNAITTAKGMTTETAEADIQNAMKSLQEAIKQAQQSIAEYEALKVKIAEVEGAYDESKEGAAALKAALDNAKDLVVNAEATSEQLAEEILVLDKALLAFNLANATEGTVPTVTATNHYVATGATQALMRATTSSTNILERGVCWSKEHNPTVLDNRSTKSFSLKGTIFHVQGLEPATVYYLRPYAMTKNYQVAYGDEVKIVTHPQGTCKGTWDEGAPDEAANARCRNAIQQTIDYFNEWTGIRGFTLSGHYGASTPTADCSYGGWMRIGPNAGNQAIGTVLHETGHGVGVGTHSRWTNCADTRENTTYGNWLGREANTVLRFLENCDSKYVAFTGDKTHGWGTLDTREAYAPNGSISFDWLVNGADKDKHQELQYIGGMCILHGLFIDGLCPTSGDPNGIAGYTYNFDDTKKYYLMNKDEARGLGTGLLFQRSASLLGWKHNLTDEAISDSAAWYMEFNAKTGHYMFKNVATGRYLSRSSSSMTLKSTSTPTVSERFQLMPDRTDVTLGTGNQKLTTHGYWFTWNDNGDKAMVANTYLNALGYGGVAQTAFSFSNSATTQQWIIISEDELETYRNIAIATNIHDVTPKQTVCSNADVEGIYTADGMKMQQLQKGINIIRYKDGTNKKVFVK